MRLKRYFYRIVSLTEREVLTVTSLLLRIAKALNSNLKDKTVKVVHLLLGKRSKFLTFRETLSVDAIFEVVSSYHSAEIESIFKCVADSEEVDARKLAL